MGFLENLSDIREPIPAEMINGPKDGAIVSIRNRFTLPLTVKFEEPGTRGYAVHVYERCNDKDRVARYKFQTTIYHKGSVPDA